jgi:hypothetical protein
MMQNAPPRKGAPLACIGAGTGLGECFLTMDNGHYVAYPSEGGHAEFPPRTETEVGLWDTGVIAVVLGLGVGVAGGCFLTTDNGHYGGVAPSFPPAPRPRWV